MKAAYNSDGTVTLLHGTSSANAELIKAQGFKTSNPAAVAKMVEDEYNLPEGSVLNNRAYEFAKHRSDLDKVHFTSNFDVAAQYTVPEQLQDALTAAYWVLHPEIGDMNINDVHPKLKEWVSTEGKRLAQPKVLAVIMPWELIGDYAFSRKISLAEYQEIADGDLPDLVSIPVAMLVNVKVQET